MIYLQHNDNHLYGEFFKLKQWQSDYLIAQDADNAATGIGLMCTVMVQVLTKWQSLCMDLHSTSLFLITLYVNTFFWEQV